jgi:6,7-dimethyl-8-ribityllumazine synthase
MVRTYTPRVLADGLNLAIVISRFNELITSQLLEGALDALERHSVAECNADVFWVPGSFELPCVARKVCESGRYDGIIALGALLRGDTDHYDLLAAEVTKGLANLSMKAEIPVAFGVLTCDALEQALHRAGTKSGNKGADAMISLLEMINLYGAIDQPEETEGE